MADRTISVKYSADLGTTPADLLKLADAYDRVADSATKAGNVKLASISRTTRQLGDDADKAAPKVGKLGAALSKIDRQSANLDRIGGSLAAFGTAGALGLGAVTKAAIDWESAWAGVTKTVDGSPEQMAALEAELRGLAKTLPATHDEIAGVAEAAGQLGVKREDVAQFTKVMVGLGETTNLSADEAATSLAQLMNVMGTAPENVDRLASVLVGLGNSGASTEKQIIEMAQRISGAGTQLGLSEGQVLAYANALASVGIEAEAGGSAISTSFLRIEQAVRSGGAELDVLAKTAGMTSAEFRTAFQENAAGALNTFIQGLGEVQAQGGDTTAILEQLEITGIREADALRRLASSGNLLTDSLAQQETLWRDNNAATAEAEKRYQTTASQVQIAWNQIKDSAIDAGAGILPVVSQIATAVAGLAQSFGDLSPEMQSGMVQAGAVVAGVALVGGGALKAATSVAGLVTAFTDLKRSSPGTSGNVRNVAEAATALGVALAAVGTAAVIFDELGTKAASAQQVRSALLDLAVAGGTAEDQVRALDAAFAEGNAADSAATFLLGQQARAEDMASALDMVVNKKYAFDAVMSGIIPGEQNFEKARASIEAVDAELAGLVSSGNPEAASAAFAKIAASTDIPVEQLVDEFGAYRDELLKTSETTRGTSASASELADWMVNGLPPGLAATEAAAEQTSGATVTLTTRQDELRGASERLDGEIRAVTDSLTILKNGALGAEQANIGWEASIDDLSESTARNRDELIEQAKATGKGQSAAEEWADSEIAAAKSLDVNTDAGRTNRTSIIDAMRAMNDKAAADFKATLETEGLSVATKNASADLKTNRDRLRDAAIAAGFSKDEVHDMIDQYVLTPDELATQIKTPGMTSTQAEIKSLQEKIKGLQDEEVEVKVNYRIDSTGAVSINGGPKFRADAAGGYIQGPGTGTSDSIPSMLSNGEFVVKASSTKSIGADRLDHMNRTGQLPAFKNGGLVSRDLNVLMRTSEAPSVDQSVAQMTDKFAAAVGSAVGQAMPKKIDLGGPNGPSMGSSKVTGLRGHRFTENFANRLRLVERQLGSALNITQGGFRPRTPYSGTSHEGDAVDIARPYGFRTIDLLRKQGIAAWDRAGKGNWIDHVHGVPLPYAGKAGGSAIWQAKDFLAGGDGLKDGGLLSGPGGDRQDNLLFWGSNGERVTNARSSAQSANLLRDINYGQISDRNYVRANAAGGAAGAPLIDYDALGQAVARHTDYRRHAAATRAGTHAGVQEGMSNVHWETSAVDVTAVGVVA